MLNAQKMLEDFTDAEAFALEQAITQTNPSSRNKLISLKQAFNIATYIIEHNFGSGAPAATNHEKLAARTRKQLETILESALEASPQIPLMLRNDEAFKHAVRGVTLGLYDANIYRGKFVGDASQLRETIASFAIILAAEALELR